MQADREVRSVLVPVIGGDVSEAVVDQARALLDATGARLVLLHVGGAASARVGPAGPAGVPARRWRRLAEAVAPGRVFVEAVSSDSATVVTEQADRFGCDAIVLGEPAPERARGTVAPALPARATRRTARPRAVFAGL